MRKPWILGLILLFLVLLIPPYAHVPAQAAAQGRKFALVIGIGQGYQSPAFRTLQHPEEDARNMAARLQQLGFKVVAEVTGEQATRDGIRQAIGELGEAANSPTDVVIIYYSGHGALIRGADGHLRPSIVPRDAAPNNKLSFIQDTDLGNWLNTAIATKKVVLIFDSCYSAGIGGGGEKRLTTPEQMNIAQVNARLAALQLGKPIVIPPRPTVAPTPAPVVVHTPQPTPAPIQGSGLLSPTPPSGVPQEQFQFAPVPAGTFMMGSPASEPGRYDDEVQHQVTISRPFAMQTTEVTQALWQAVMGSNPSKFKGADLPVENVSWDDAQAFVNKLNEMMRTYVYRLPTEAEWEYAARAGTTTAYAGSLDAMAWYGNNSGRTTLNADEIWRTDKDNYGKRLQANGNQTHAVSRKQPNAWGLYDMHGNVWEWVQDWYEKDYRSGSVTDPTGPSTGSYRVDRGGSWGNLAQDCRSAIRGGPDPGDRHYALGFRLSRSV